MAGEEGPQYAKTPLPCWRFSAFRAISCARTKLVSCSPAVESTILVHRQRPALVSSTLPMAASVAVEPLTERRSGVPEESHGVGENIATHSGSGTALPAVWNLRARCRPHFALRSPHPACLPDHPPHSQSPCVSPDPVGMVRLYVYRVQDEACSHRALCISLHGIAGGITYLRGTETARSCQMTGVPPAPCPSQ